MLYTCLKFIITLLSTHTTDVIDWREIQKLFTYTARFAFLRYDKYHLKTKASVGSQQPSGYAACVLTKFLEFNSARRSDFY